MKTTHLIQTAIATAALSLSGAALAQPVDSEAPVPVESGPAENAPADNAPADAAQPMPAAQIVDREFGTYDLDKNGQLNEAEFTSWVSKLRKPAADGAAPEDTQSWATSLFARADTDGDKQISKGEMTSLLNAAQG